MVVCKCGFFNVWVCMCEFCNVFGVCMCAFCNVFGVCMCGFFNVCVRVGFLICGFVYEWVL